MLFGLNYTLDPEEFMGTDSRNDSVITLKDDFEERTDMHDSFHIREILNKI